MNDCLTTIGREFVGAETNTDVYRALVAAADQLLDADKWQVAVADGDVLRPDASTDSHEGSPSGIPIATSIPGTVFSRGEPCVIDDLNDVRSTAAEHSATTPTRPDAPPAYHSLVVVPVDEVGVLIGAAREPAAFSETDRERALHLATAAASALERTQSTDSSGPDRLDEIASILSHDLKTPLQVARGRLELAESTGDDTHLSRVADALDRIEALADDLVKLARTDERIGPKDSVDLHRLVENAWMTVDAPAASLQLEDSAELLVDESTACQLFENLFSNAIDHAGPTVTVRVGTLPTGFYVEDDGPGIPPDRRDRVFEWRVSSAAGHNGYGLAIVDRIAEAHGWDITVTDSESGGARFEVSGVDFAGRGD